MTGSATRAWSRSTTCSACRIVAQQGDLAFVKMDEPHKSFGLEEFTTVNAYDNHEFDGPVDFVEYDGKENILGYLRIHDNTWLRHHEHEHVLIPAGSYELRACRSWEANPKSVWTLRID
jgi:hypothetical protein